MTDDPGVALANALAAAAERIGVGSAISGPTTNWSRGDRAFAILTGGVLEVRLDGPIAAAARRTPDTSASRRGPEWVRFAPPELDAMALDRAQAWFEAAWRRSA